jgi:2-polyprenyl-3-methyl-5-hydroxy-6-metoxy-1,4-benzoquinol methylase
MIQKTCDVCNSPLIFFLETKDHFHSGEKFILLKCEECKLVHTHPVPSPEDMPTYYASDKYISHNSRKLNLFTAVYKLIRRISIKNKFNLITVYQSHPNIFDYGCGTGNFLKYCKDRGYPVTGVEPNEAARHTASMILNQPVLPKLSSLVRTYNVITLWHVLEHLHDPTETLKSLIKHLDNKGILIIAVPNYDSWDAHHYRSLWAAYDVPRHIHHYNQKAMDSLVNKLGMKIVKKHPMKFDAYFVSLLSEQYAGSGAFSYLRAILNGFKSNRKAVGSMNYSSLIYVIQR